MYNEEAQTKRNRMKRIKILFLPFFFVFGCAHPRTKIDYGPGMAFSSYRRVAVLPFSDPKGRGALIAEKIIAGLQRAGFECPSVAKVSAVLSGQRPDPDFGLGITALTDLQARLGVKAVVIGAISREENVAAVNVVETGMGDRVLSAVIVPPGKDEKSFASVSELVKEVLKVLGALEAPPHS